MGSLLETGKDGYSSDDEFDRRTKAALNREASEWGNPGKLFERDAVEVLEFVQGDYEVVAPILAGLGRYTVLDLGCGYGRLAPFLSAFDCASYLGVEPQCRERANVPRVTLIANSVQGFTNQLWLSLHQ